MNQPLEIDVQDIDHLGIIAGIIDEIGIVEITNGLLDILWKKSVLVMWSKP